MLIVDDLLVRPFLGIVDALHTLALDELYDIDAIEDDLKENQLLYEIGDRSESEYEARTEALEEELAIAQEIHEELTSGRIEVKS